MPTLFFSGISMTLMPRSPFSHKIPKIYGNSAEGVQSTPTPTNLLSSMTRITGPRSASHPELGSRSHPELFLGPWEVVYVFFRRLTYSLAKEPSLDRGRVPPLTFF